MKQADRWQDDMLTEWNLLEQLHSLLLYRRIYIYVTNMVYIMKIKTLDFLNQLKKNNNIIRKSHKWMREGRGRRHKPKPCRYKNVIFKKKRSTQINLQKTKLKKLLPYFRLLNSKHFNWYITIYWILYFY